MCFEASARPPEPPRTGALGATERLTLRASDGNELAATLALTTAPGSPGVVVLPDVRGLHPYYEALARAFAEAGVSALAIDLYGRSAGAAYREEGFDYQPQRAATTDAGVALDARAALQELRSRGASRVYALGFCFGGRAAFMQASNEDLAGVVGFYGWPTRGDNGSPLEEARAGRLRVPVLALYGGADEKITSEDAHVFAQALDAMGVPQESIVYDGAPHSFFDRAMSEHVEACADAWLRILRFMGVPARA